MITRKQANEHVSEKLVYLTLSKVRLCTYAMCSLDCFCHYENMPMQCTEIFKVVKNENFKQKNVDSFLIFAQSIHCGYSLEPPRQGCSNEYPQSMFWSKSKKCIPQFCYIIVGFKEVYISWTCFPDGVIVGLIELSHKHYTEIHFRLGTVSVSLWG